MAGIRAMGAKLSYTDGTTGKKYVAHLTSLGALNTTNADVDVTDHDSPNGNAEFVAGQKTHDNVSFKGNVAKGDDTFGRIWALAQNRNITAFEAEYANGDSATFSGFIAKASMGEQTTDGLMGYEGEIKVSGEVVYTPATA